MKEVLDEHHNVEDSTQSQVMQFDLVIMEHAVKKMVGQRASPRSWKAVNETSSPGPSRGKSQSLGMRHPSGLDKSPLACRMVRQVDKMFNLYHCAIEARKGRSKMMAHTKREVHLSPFLSLVSVFSLSISLYSSWSRRGNDARKEKAKARSIRKYGVRHVGL
jgi:hypothetical protein